MQDRSWNKLELLVLALVVALIVLSCAPTWADDDDCRGHSCTGADVDVETLVESPVSTSVSHTSRALGLGAGDVDINDCYRSWSVVVYQDSKPNLLCLARDLEAEGKHEAAARLRCQPWSVRRAFGGRAKCIEALQTTQPTTARAGTPVEPPTVAVEIHDREIIEEEHELAQVQLAEQQELIEAQRAELRRLRQQENEDARRRAAARAALEDDEDE